MVARYQDDIAKLESLYAENPEGRVFTHLAEAYRKAGELDRARDVLETGLRVHEDYASAHVVLGRVRSDQGDHAGAEQAFRRVIELDPQNLVALRALGDRARESGRDEEAVLHYRELLALDPSDDEISDYVARYDMVASSSPDAAPEPAAPVEPEPSAWSPDMEEPAAATMDAELIDFGPLDFGGGQEGEGELLDVGDLGSSDLTFDEAEAPGAGDVPPVDAGAIEAEALDAGPLDEAAMEPLDEAPFDAESLDVNGLDAGPLDEAAVTASLDATPADSEMVTETMGDLYSRQGFNQRAVDVYRRLLEQRPGDSRLEVKLAEAEFRVREHGEVAEPGHEALPAEAGGLETAEFEPPEAGALEGASPPAGFEPLDEGIGVETGDELDGWAEEPLERTDLYDAPLGDAEADEDETAVEEVEAAWTGRGGAAGTDATPYGWTDEEETAEDLAAGGAPGPPIRDQLASRLSWQPTERPTFSREMAAAAPPYTEEPAEAAGPAEQDPAEHDDDLDMFRAWLQSLKH